MISIVQCLHTVCPSLYTPFTGELQVKELQNKLEEQQRKNREKQKHQYEKVAKEAAEWELHYVKANLQKGSLYQVCSSLITFIFSKFRC